MDIPASCLPLFHRIRAHHSESHVFAYYLEYLTFHFPTDKLEYALGWLIKNGVIGEKFLEFIHHECAGSGLEMIRYLTMRLEREKKPRVLTAKDIQ